MHINRNDMARTPASVAASVSRKNSSADSIETFGGMGQVIGFQCLVMENSGLFSEWSTEDEGRSWFHRASANTSEEA